MPILMLVGASVAAYQASQNHTSSSSQTTIDLKDKTMIELLPLERTTSLLEAPISTITFFRGDYGRASDLLRERVDTIVTVNPWLGGWMVTHRDTDKGGTTPRPVLAYDATGEQRAPDLFRAFAPGSIALGRRTLYANYHGVIKNHGVRVKRNSLIIDRDEAIWRVSLVPDFERPQEGFALVVSMSHVCGDGHTFYKIYESLVSVLEKQSMGVPPVPTLNPRRKLEFSEAIMDVMGRQEAFFVSRVAKNPLWEMTSSRKDEMCGSIFYICDKWIETQRKATTGAGDTPVSSNDVITCWFWKTLKPTVGLMPFNFRGRLSSGCDELDAGNYQNPIPYTSEDYATPLLIQKSVKVAKRAADPATVLPNIHWNSTFSVSTNWASFCKSDGKEEDRTNQDNTGKDQLNDFQIDVHLPLYDTAALATLPNQLSVIIIFQICPGRLGAFVLAPQGEMPKIENCGIVEKVVARF